MTESENFMEGERGDKPQIEVGEAFVHKVG